ncbi:hypothetical protein [Dactylosporangium sp. NPDC048998]|uniref:hypothetical protein n=1 Tax=Dactylosporangium sp. NPDC048998 TaxID=3363976 RepID=UPI003720EA70
MRLLPILGPPAAVLMLAACTAGGTATPPRSSPSAAPAVLAQPAHSAQTACGSPVETGPLPEWARGGFSDGGQWPYVMGDGGAVLAVLFVRPLAVTRTDGANNKILWVARDPFPPGDLVIDAALGGSGETARRSVPGGPGPSIVDLPRPGCWRLTLTWPGHTDTLDLTYE